MAFSLRGNSDRTPLLRSSLPISSGPAEAADEAPTPAAAPTPRQSAPTTPAPETLSPAARRAAMSGLDATERKWALGGLIVEFLTAALLTIYLAVDHPTKSAIVHHKKTLVPLSDSYLLYGIVALVICLVGLFALQRNRRTMVSFALILSGFVITEFYPPIGFAFVVLGGWLLWRAYRIQRYGTANAREAARVAATQPRQSRAARKAAAASPSKPAGYKAPSANKRYTPKAAPRKKVPKPTE